jgi:hypothetical protein
MIEEQRDPGMTKPVRLGWTLVLVGLGTVNCGRTALQHPPAASRPDAAARTDAAISAPTDASSQDRSASDGSQVIDVMDSALACASQVEIASLADVPFAAAPRWVNEYCSDSYYGVQITPDLVATTALVLDAYEIPVPSDCITCADHVGFQLTEPIAGVTTDTPALNVADRYLRASPGAVFRLRPVLRCNHPMIPDPLPTVLVLPPCSQACARGASKCDLDQVCYPAGTLFCRSCEGKDSPSCACRTPAGVESDGTQCQYLRTDVVTYGFCQAGYCFVYE